ncbi:type IV pilin protein [Dyella sp.]|uniref:type IV pilin protein n=1 Tax=Dyella sp. TaxID=1869338 RepID=UPI002B468B0A|nr:prepilin-type N-terminal cleavage/methylation domain-containing protein [Dyella sp.]HKT26594.1 prepilin-type N-terminal cleavage/methylation domain-containing protein [Dyella sp.]
MNSTRSQRGFTLIELMVVIVIIAILASIAMSAYGSYITRAKVQAAKADLTALSLNLQNELQRNLVYGTHSNITTDSIRNAYKGWAPSQDATFTYTLDSSPTTYTMTAQGKAGPLATCSLTLDDAGQRGISGSCASITTW